MEQIDTFCNLQALFIVQSNLKLLEHLAFSLSKSAYSGEVIGILFLRWRTFNTYTHNRSTYFKKW
jgi:hypothetical protein